MIRIQKTVQLLEWGEGTKTTNQNWNKAGEGKIRRKPKTVDGITTMEVELAGPFAKSNALDDSLKVMQQGEGMTNGSEKWGEVGIGRLKAISQDAGKTIVSVELRGAIKYGY